MIMHKRLTNNKALIFFSRRSLIQSNKIINHTIKFIFEEQA